jgi:hypothetical protein
MSIHNTYGFIGLTYILISDTKIQINFESTKYFFTFFRKFQVSAGRRAQRRKRNQSISQQTDFRTKSTIKNKIL